MIIINKTSQATSSVTLSKRKNWEFAGDISSL